MSGSRLLFPPMSEGRQAFANLRRGGVYGDGFVSVGEIVSARRKRIAKGAWRTFLQANKRVCAQLERSLPQAEPDIHAVYESFVATYLSTLPAGAKVVDVGGGRKCDFAKYRSPRSGIKLIAVDISAEELEFNTDVDEMRVADVTRELPFDDEEVDLIVSRSVLEHLQNSESFIAHSARTLKRGGYAIHVFPSKYAPFAMINRLLPHPISKWLLHILIPGSEGRLGFRAYYDRTYKSGMKRVLEKHDFKIIDIKVNYYQAEYFNFFVPLFVLNVLYELIVYGLRLENLGASVLVVARKV
jgi:SAM-dependent methyltransferase